MRGQHRLTDDPDEFSFALFAVIFDTNTRFPYRLTCEKIDCIESVNVCDNN